jgi:hypothetical protein
MTPDVFLSAVGFGTPRDNALNVVAVRLLAVTVMVTNWRGGRALPAAVSVPKDYRAWPQLDFERGVPGLSHRLRLYVSPKAAALSDDEAFPVGTTLVVETVVLSDSEDTEPASVFVMAKVSSLLTRTGTCGSRDGWAYAAYESMGCAIKGVSTASGICRVPVGKA